MVLTPTDRRPQTFFKRDHRAPSKTVKPAAINGIAAIVARPICDKPQQRFWLPQVRQNMFGDHVLPVHSRPPGLDGARFAVHKSMFNAGQ